MFGSTSFTNQPTSTFGNFTAGANTTTPSLFGQSQQTTAMPLFGSTNTATGFNTPLKQTSFGTSFGSTPSNVVTPLFGTAQPNRVAPVSATTGIFSNPVTTITPFSQGQAQGTSIAFNALSGTDTMMRNGQPSPISTRHQCITCMKEYENKSLEELRIEDYQLGRKGSAQTGLFGSTVSQQPTSIFAGLGSTTAPAFGQQRTTTFGTPSTNTGLFSNLSQPKPPSLFSSTNTGTTFGAPTFSFPTTTTQSSGLLFNQNNSTTSTTAAPFSFASQPQTQMNLFNSKPLTAPATTTTTFTGFNNTLNKPLGIFSSTASAPFGSTNTLGASTAAPSLFSQQPQNKPFQPFSFPSQPTTQSFGQAPTSSFSFSTPTTTTSSISFGSTPAPMFGPGASNTGFSFSANPTTLSLGAPTTTTSTFPSFSFPSQTQQQPGSGFSFFNNANSNTATNLQATPQQTGPVPFATTPYKDSPLFYNVITNRNLEEMTKPTNPLAQRAVKEASRRRTSSHFSLSCSTSAVGNLTFSGSRNSSYSSKQSSIFDGFEQDNYVSAVDVLSPKSSIKKLSLKDVPGLGEHISVKPHPTMLKNSSQNFNDSMSNGRNKFSERSANYSISNTIGENNSMMSPMPATPQDHTSIDEEPQQGHSNTFHDSSSMMQETNRSVRTQRPRPNKCRVKCTRAGYYTEPTVEELDYITEDDGHCCVDGFIIGRHNFGRIQFLDIVDLSGLNLDDLVHFRHKETVVYPDDSVKPPVGQGINVPAEITMERIWPMDKSTQEPIKSPSRIKAMNYEEKLRRSCKRMDANFVSYDPELGVWIFQVKHFSKYTCEPEENEDKGENACRPKLMEERSGLGGIHVEQFPVTQFQFPVSENHAEFHINIKRSPPSSIELTPPTGASAIWQDVDTGLEAGDTNCPQNLLHQLKLEETFMEDMFSRLIKPRAQVRKIINRRQLLLPTIKRPIDMFTPLLDETACVPSRSSRGGRVGFGPGGHVLNIRSNRANGFTGEVNILRLQPYFERLEMERTPGSAVRALRAQLKVQLESSELFNEEKFNSCLFGNVASQMAVLKDLRQKASTGNVSKKYNELLEQEEHMWNLCNILWPADQVEANFAGRLERQTSYYQRQEFSQWLSSNGVGIFDNQIQDNSVNALFRRGQKLKACEEAVELNNCTLALCLAQNSYDAKQTCDSQMVRWEKCEAEEFVSPELKELYQVCSGCPIWDRVNLLELTSSEWLQHFAVYNWYLAPIHQSISKVVELYHQFIKMAIIPAGCDTSDFSFPASTHTETTIANLCINLLKAYSCSGYPVTKLLAPINYSPDSLDYKISWLLMNNVMRFGFDVDAELFNTISSSFAGQLETLGCFEWAVFVLQHCDPSEERNCMIKRILERNLFKTSDIKLENFISLLGDHSKDMWDAKAVAAVKNKRAYEELWTLLRSAKHAFSNCHDFESNCIDSVFGERVI